MIHNWDLTNLLYSNTLQATPPTNTVSGMMNRTADRHTPLTYFSVLQHERLRHKYLVHSEFYRLAVEIFLDQDGGDDTSEGVHLHS
jgi:hypothetical protein